MSDLSFGKLIVPSLLTTGAVFTALSAPVVMFADTPLNIQQGNRAVYSGTVRNAALPYLALAGTASVSLGVAVVASAGWRKAAKRADDLSETLESQADRRAERQAHLEAALASENYLKKSGLDFFLEDGELTPFVPEAMPLNQSRLPVEASASMSVDRRSARSIVLPEVPAEVPVTLPVHAAPRTAELADQLAWLEADEVPVLPSPLVASPSPAPLPSAQGFYGFTRETHVPPKTLLQTVAPSATASSAMTVQDQQTIAQINSLQNQLQTVVSQIDALRSQLPVQGVAATPVSAGVEVVSQLPDSHNGLVQQSFESTADERRSGEERRSDVGAVNLRRLAS